MRKFICVILLVIVHGYSQPDIVVTRDPNPNPDYVTYAEWLESHPETATSAGGPTVQFATFCSNAPDASPKGLIAVVVEEGLETTLSYELNQYVEDLKDQGYDVEMSIYSTAGTADELRLYLGDRLHQGLLGAVFVGELPVAWFQMNCLWNGYNEPPSYEEFPCDLYFCDLDGTWSDDSTRPYCSGFPLEEGPDGIYDSHSGDRTPEIWVSRIDASNISVGDPITLYRDYFARVHDYRTGTLTLVSKGLFFIDQDWSQSESFYNQRMNLITEYYDEIRDTMIANAGTYKNLLGQKGLYLTVCVHSSPWCHYFHDANGGDDCQVRYYDIDSIEPGYAFYNLFACSNCRWVEKNCMGSIYQFSGNGLGVVGSAKTGSMLYFSKFNIELSRGKNWGEAFKEWTRYWLTDLGYEYSTNDWFMGMCLLGDASLDLINADDLIIPDSSLIRIETSTVTKGDILIRLYLPRTENVRISIFDLSGRLVEPLYNGYMEEGIYSTRWVPGDGPTGVYYIVINSATEQKVQKVVRMN
ncbi:T9SS type A sorting domain-containing protein [candidate division WOR-3 bacterium]|nr:T9SS type A sorting domain-containing protein [candidate division WOR-3 bacterium]